MAVAGFNMAAALDMAGFRLRPLLRRWQAVWSREHRAHIYVRFYFCEASNTWRMDNGTPQSPTWARPGGIVFVAVVAKTTGGLKLDPTLAWDPTF